MYKAILPNQSIFEPSAAINAETAERVRIVEKIEYPEEGGVLVYYQNLKYPKKSCLHPMSVIKTSIVKRGLMEVIRFMVSLPKVIFSPKSPRSIPKNV